MNKKVMVLGDLHLGVSKSDAKFFDTALKYAEWVKKLCNEQGITQIIHLGDIFHHQYVLCVGTLNAAYKFFDILKEFDIHIVLGNHDVPTKHSVENHSLKLLSEWPNITVHDKVTTIDDITFCGWGTKLEDIPEKQKIIFGHFDIKGFDMSASKVAEHGFTASELMERCEMLMSGHYHKPQRRFYKNKLLTYAGSCYQLNWGESGEEKYAYVLDTETLSYEAIPNNISPRFEYIRSEKDYHKIANNFVAIEVSMEEHAEKVMQMLANNALDVKTINRTTKVIEVGDLKSVEEFKGVSISDIIQEYTELIEDVTEEEKIYLAKKANQLYNECI
jgi:DNA repair exonuclease SbcCD nuclease subunit